MFRNLLKPDSALMITMSRITDCIFLSLFWLLCCIPVVTTGASFAALYDASYRTFRRNERNSWQRFFGVFRSNWKAGILPTVVFLFAGWGLLKAVIALWNLSVAGTLPWMLFSALAFVAMVILGKIPGWRRSTNLPARGAVNVVASGQGVNISPVWATLNPKECCMKKGRETRANI